LKAQARSYEGVHVIRALLTFLRFLRIPTFILGRRNDRHRSLTPVRNGQFASFMSVQGCNRRHHPDRHDRRLRIQRLTRAALVIAGISGFSWVAIESAKALSVF
jgi:hypothetical protein